MIEFVKHQNWGSLVYTWPRLLQILCS